MPDLGRWFGIDQLAEDFTSISPYAYVANNPIMFTDPDGRKIKPIDGGWQFTGSDIYLIHSYLTWGGSFSNLTDQLESYGGSFGSGGIRNFWSSFSGGDTFGAVNVNKGYLSWWTNAPSTGVAGDIQGLIGHRTAIDQSGFNNYMNNQNSQNSSVGQPGEWEALIPIWGSGRAAVDHFQNGNYWRGAA